MASDSPTIRRAAATDVDPIARIWRVGWIDGHAGHVPPELVQHRDAEQFAPRAQQRLDRTWVAESGDEVVGFLVIVDDEVEQIYVDASARGTATASLLLHTGETVIRKAGYEQAWLAVVAGNARARSFYARQGWRDAGAFSYLAETEGGPLPVPCQRYEVDL
jgi:GNAT superfamily N-acetyltransferase